MAVYVSRTPVRTSTYRNASIAVAALGAIAGVISAIFWGWPSLVILPIVVWLILGLSLQQWYPEPAIDRWDQLPKEVRLQLIRQHQHTLVANGQIVNLGLKDHDPEVRQLTRESERELRRRFR